MNGETFCSVCGSHSQLRRNLRFTMVNGNLICMECWKKKQREKQAKKQWSNEE